MTMTKKQAMVGFKQMYPGYFTNLGRYNPKTDYYAMQFDWTVYIDQLCKGGDITLYQYAIWETPWGQKKKKKV